MDPASQNPNSTPDQNPDANQPAQQPEQSPGIEPASGDDIQVRSVNPPLTPDQVVGFYDKPLEVPVLPTLKLENIKAPRIKNKTIQGHLKAIEAKMSATEKLMKDVIKLQKLQIFTEKELYERKKELYQNTFEEYLLDKTIDFEDPDDPKDCVCVNLPKNPNQGGGGGGVPVPTLTPGGKKSSPEGQSQKQKKQPSQQPNKPSPPPTSPDPSAKANTPGQKSSPHRPGQKPRVRPGTPSVKPPKTAPPAVETTPAAINNVRTFTRAKTPAAGAQYRAGLPTGTRGSILSIAGQFGLGQVGEMEAQRKIDHLLKLKAENPEEYKKQLNDLRLLAKDQKLLNPLMQVIGSPDVPAAYVLKSLGALKAEEIPISLPGRDLGLTPDLNQDGSPIVSDTIDTRSDFEKKHGVTYASGGISGADLELYSAESQNYFRNISNNVRHQIPQFAGGGWLAPMRKFINRAIKPQGLSIKGAQAGFTGMAKQGFDAIMGGDKFRVPTGGSLFGKGSQPILGRGAYSAPTAKGASRYVKPGGGIVKTIVPGGARGVNFIEPQSVVKPSTFDKGKVLADKLLQGSYANSPLANKLRSQLMSGTAQNVGMSLGKTLGKASQILNMPVINDMLFPESTAKYDQLSGPNAYYNAPGYKAQKLENVQSNLKTNTTTNTPSVVPLPPNYIKIPSSKKKTVEKVGTAPPSGVNMAPSIFSRQSTFIN